MFYCLNIALTEKKTNSCFFAVFKPFLQNLSQWVKFLFQVLFVGQEAKQKKRKKGPNCSHQRVNPMCLVLMRILSSACFSVFVETSKLEPFLLLPLPRTKQTVADLLTNITQSEKVTGDYTHSRDISTD